MATSKANDPLGHLFARDEGIDPNEVFVGKVADATEAKVLLTGWRQEMPEVPSSYRSSGALPAPGLMIAGSLLGGVAGFLAAGLVVPIGGALGALIGLFAWFYEWFRHGSAEYQWYFVVIFGILAWVLAASWVPAELTMRFGRLGKNRNVPVASVLSFLSSLLALLLAGMCYYTMAKPILAQRRWDNDLLPYFVGLLGVTGACFAAFYTAEQVRAAKFCEDCQCYMDAESLKTLGLGELRTMVRALAKARLDVAGSLLHDRPTGGDGKVNLFSCPYCSRGYLEVTAKYNARWQDWRARAMDKQRSWLAASCELTAAEVIQLRRELAGPK